MGLNSTEVAYGFGQHGSGALRDTAALYAPTGKVIIAITMLEEITFHASGLVQDDSFHKATTSAATEDGVAFFGTTANVLANGEDDDGDAVTSDAIAATVKFPKGLTIYGRWTSVRLSGAHTHGIIVYFGPA
tara:strand:+ start:43 stop:438 length:396 start_codon:yes stop_codon:yes gene_type:complete